MKKAVQITTVLATILFTGTAYAGNTHNPGINKRQYIQKKRIVQGIKSGELNRREAKRLGREQHRINKKERIFKSDGTLTKKERAILHKDLNHASRHIYKEKHDRQYRH